MVSAVVIARNEEKNIASCLESLSFCSQLILVDDDSSDQTKEIARKFEAEIYKRKLENFSEQRNFGLSKAKNEWVLFIDSDEVVSKELQKEILREVKDSNCNGYLVKREDRFLGHEMRHGDLGNVWLLRLGKKDEGEWKGDVHEEWNIKGRVGKLKNPLIHTSHKDLSQFVEKINYYSSIRARELKKSDVHSSLWMIIFYTKLKFLNLYIIKFGFLDGIHGFVHALFMSFYTFLVRGKLYLLNKNVK